MPSWLHVLSGFNCNTTHLLFIIYHTCCLCFHEDIWILGCHHLNFSGTNPSSSPAPRSTVCRGQCAWNRWKKALKPGSFFFFLLWRKKINQSLPNPKRDPLLWGQVHVDCVIKGEISRLAEVIKERHPDCRQENCCWPLRSLQCFWQREKGRYLPLWVYTKCWIKSSNRNFMETGTRKRTKSPNKPRFNHDGDLKTETQRWSPVANDKTM